MIWRLSKSCAQALRQRLLRLCITLRRGREMFSNLPCTSQPPPSERTQPFTHPLEISSSGTNYTLGGATLTNITPVTSGTTAYWSFQDVTFSNVTLTCAGALIYNSTNGNRAVCVLNFGQTITKNASNLIVTFPPMGATDSVLRIA